MPALVRHLRLMFVNHPCLSLALLFSIGFFLLFPARWSFLIDLLVWWNSLVWVYLGLSLILIMKSDSAHIVRISCKEDEHGAIILAFFSVATLFSLAAIAIHITSQKSSPETIVVNTLLTVLTIVGSWFFLGVLFTFHYCRKYYQNQDDQPPLCFPDDKSEPDYWDFLYFSFTLCVAVQTSDVQVMNRSFRKLVLAQSILYFFYNFAIIGLSVNVMAGLIPK